MHPLKPLFAGMVMALAACSGAAEGSGDISQYRAAIVERCAGDGTAQTVCACGYDTWVASLDNPNSPGALAAARIYSSPEDAPANPQDIMTGMAALQAIGPAMMQCMDTNFDALQPDMDDADTAAGDDTEAIMRRQLEAAGRGDLAEGFGDGRYDLEDLRRMDEIEQARRDREAADAAEAREARQADMDALYTRRDAANDALMQGDPTARPVSAYEDAFALNCQADGNEAVYCGCKWSSFLDATGGRDDAPARVAALMATVPPSDLTGISPETFSAAADIHGTYVTAASDTCSG